MRERNVGFLGGNRNRLVAKTGVILAATAALLTTEQVASAETIYSAPATWQGRPGTESPGYQNVPSPGSVPIIEDFSGSVQETTQNYIDAINRGGHGQLNGFSASAIAARDALMNPSVADKIDKVRLTGDPCMVDGARRGVLVASPDARRYSGVSCPTDLPANLPATLLYDVEDPIANFHVPVNAIDIANMLVAHRNRHNYRLRPGTYDMTRHSRGNKEYIVVEHHHTALRDFLWSSGVRISDADEQKYIAPNLPHRKNTPHPRTVTPHHAAVNVDIPTPQVRQPQVVRQYETEAYRTVDTAAHAMKPYVPPAQRRAVKDIQTRANKVVNDTSRAIGAQLYRLGVR